MGSTQRSLKMRLIWTSLALVLASLWHVQGYTCPPGKSKKTITLGVGESVDFSTQDADSYGKNVKCVVKFKKAKKAKCELNFSCSAFTLTAKNSNCNRGSDFLKIGKEKFCEDNSPDVTVAGRTLNVLFRSNKRSKGGEGAECEATCVDPDDETPTTVAPPATTPPPPVTTAAPTTGTTPAPRVITWSFGMSEAVECVKPGTSVIFEWSGSSHNVDKVGSAEDYASCSGITDTTGVSGPYTWQA